MKGNKLECQILCNGQPLHEYHTTLNNEKFRSCWVASEAGKTFTIKITNGHSQTDFTCKVFVDGHCTNSRSMKRGAEDRLQGMRTGPNCMRQYIFAPIRLTDEDDTLATQQSQNNAEDIGEICLKWYRSTHSGKCPSTTHDARGLEDVALNEKTKKLGGHRVILGDEIVTHAFTFSRAHFIDPEKNPYYTFTWRYRPKEFLQAQGMIPLDVPQVVARPTLKRPRPTLSIDGPSKRQHVNENEQRLAIATSSRVKVEDAIDIGALEAQRDALEEQIRLARQSQHVKREVSPIVLGAVNGIVIDLTED